MGLVDAVLDMKSEIVEGFNTLMYGNGELTAASTEEDPYEEPNPEPVEDFDPMEYRDQSFTLSTISKGLDMKRLSLINLLFENDRIKMELTITKL